MAIERFEELKAWQKSKILAVKVYGLFAQNKDFGFRDQIQRASVSVMNNIAEGFERKSNNQFKYFLSIAKGSCGEVRSMAILAEELQMISKDKSQELILLTIEVSKIISGLMKVL